MNLATILEMATEGFGDRVAIGSLSGGLTFADVRDQARAFAGTIPEGVRAVATLTPTSERTPVALFGSVWAGKSYVPLNFRLPEDARAQLLARIKPALLLDESWTPAPSGDAGRAYPEEPDQPAVLLFTSGTSAAPKAAVLQHDQLLAYVFNTLDFASAEDDEAVLVAVPPFHVAGVAAVLSATYVGRRVVPLARFDAEAWLATASSERVTHAFVVPTMLARIVDVLEHHPDASPTTLRHLAYGGARMPLPVLERALELLPDVAFVNAYGLTETSSTVCVLGPKDHRAGVSGDDPVLRARLTSAGRPVPGVEIRIVDDGGQAVGADVVGEIHLRGDQIGGSYLDTDSRVSDEGWLRTGDLGWVDAEGYLFVQGRGDGTIIRGGENIAAAEIEDAILAHPEVIAAAVVGVPDPEWGETPAAAVVPRSGPAVDLDDLRRFVQSRIGTLKTPTVIVVRAELPQTATGKIVHRIVREDLLARELASDDPRSE
ncbi:MAG TPA: AMP-binding protein [Acidimicrobiia bacterium]|jgi:acyl-CoA synthetase (AMP-forming)/AMP-acid ligase II